MANINLTYWGLTGVKGTVTVDEAVLVDGLITAIATDEGLDTNYYVVSKLDDPSKSSYYYSDSSTTINTIGITNGSVLLCTPNQTGSKEQRQIQKLDIAQRKRQGGPADDSSVDVPYYRILNEYDRDSLPTKYVGNTVVDNANPAGLLPGRPWTGVLTAPTVFTTNLVLNLDPESTSSYPGSGTTWFDIAGTAQNLALVGSPTFTNTTPKYFTFNGTTQRATGTDTGVISTTAYTKSAWFYLNGYQDNNIFSGDGHFIYMGPQASIDKKIYCGHADWGSFTAFPSVATINLSTWYNVTLTFSTANGMTLYINGVQDSTYTVLKTAHPGTGTVSVGAYVTGNLLKGRVGKVLAYNAELTAAQVLQNFNATKATYGL